MTQEELTITLIQHKSEMQALKTCFLAIIAMIDLPTAEHMEKQYQKHYEQFLRQNFAESEFPNADKAIKKLLKDIPGLNP